LCWQVLQIFHCLMQRAEKSCSISTWGVSNWMIVWIWRNLLKCRKDILELILPMWENKLRFFYFKLAEFALIFLWL
jgi:hypothetical protein